MNIFSPAMERNTHFKVCFMKHIIRGWVHPKKWAFTHYLLDPMLMESCVKFSWAQNISGASKQKTALTELKKQKKQNMASRSLSLEPLRSHIDLRRRCLLSFEAKIFTVAASLIALARVPSEVGTRAPSCLEGVNNTFSNQFGSKKHISGMHQQPINTINNGHMQDPPETITGGMYSCFQAVSIYRIRRAVIAGYLPNGLQRRGSTQPVITSLTSPLRKGDVAPNGIELG